MRNIACIFVLVLFITLMNDAVAASLVIKDKCTIVLSGEIDKFTDVDLSTSYKSLNDGKPEKCNSDYSPRLYFNSGGGDVDAAMKAGYFIRQKNFKTWVDSKASCASACVLMFLGGVDRTVWGRVGLHRPYSLKYSDSESDSRASYEKINNQISQYLSRMNITTDLLNRMNSVSPGEIKWLIPADNDNDYRLLVLQRIF